MTPIDWVLVVGGLFLVFLVAGVLFYGAHLAMEALQAFWRMF